MKTISLRQVRLSTNLKYIQFHAKVSEENEVFVYRISVLNEKGKTVHEDWVFSDYFFADKPESITFDGFITLSKYFTVKVYAEDVWGNKSEPLEIKI